jgi:hypothetical protein
VVWFQLLAWTLARAAHRECERACDDVVIGAGVRPSEYASELLAIAQAAAADPLHGGALAVARPGQLEGRLLAILNAATRRGPASRGAVAIAGLIAVAMFVTLTSVRVVAASREPATEPWTNGPVLRSSPALTESNWSETKTESGWSASTPVTTTTDPKTETACKDEAASSSSSASAGESESGSADGPLFRLAQSLSRSRSGEEWYSEAKDLYDQEEYLSSGELYERAARAGYRPATAWYNAACSFALANRVNRAINALNAAIDAGWDDVGKIQSDDDLDAIRSDSRYRMLIREMKDSGPEEIKQRGAKNRYEALRGSSDADPDQLRSVGIELMRSGEPNMAAEAFARQYAIDSLGSSLYNMACAQAIAGQKAKACATLERAIYAGYGDAEKLESDDDLNALHGQPEFRRLVRLADDFDLEMPNNGFNFGGDDADGWRRLLPRFERATREHPNAGRAWFNLGFAQLRAEDPRGSRASYLRALDQGYRRGATCYNIACAAAALRDNDEAIRWLQRSEQAGYDVAGTARSDDDLRSLRRDDRFMDMIDRWEAQKDRKHFKYKDSNKKS